MCLSSSPSVLRVSSITGHARDSDLLKLMAAQQSSGKKAKLSERLTTMGEIREEMCENDEQDESMLS
jgi:hypothetical protein